jgi:hypothetical protein
MHGLRSQPHVEAQPAGGAGARHAGVGQLCVRGRHNVEVLPLAGLQAALHSCRLCQVQAGQQGVRVGALESKGADACRAGLILSMHQAGAAAQLASGAKQASIRAADAGLHVRVELHTERGVRRCDAAWMRHHGPVQPQLQGSRALCCAARL